MTNINGQNPNDPKIFWENCNPTFAHITINKWLKNYQNLVQSWDSNFLKYLNKIESLNNKTVIDYGIGGGYLGIYLYTKYNIAKYIGIDISDRQLKYASENLKKYHINYELFITPINFNTIHCDIFISQAVIQHFPNIEYLDAFLNNINTSNIPIIMLQIRHNKNTVFNSGDYTNIKEVTYKCHTNEKYITSRLTNYEINHKGPVLHNKYQFLVYNL